MLFGSLHEGSCCFESKFGARDVLKLHIRRRDVESRFAARDKNFETPPVWVSPRHSNCGHKGLPQVVWDATMSLPRDCYRNGEA